MGTRSKLHFDASGVDADQTLTLSATRDGVRVTYRVECVENGLFIDKSVVSVDEQRSGHLHLELGLLFEDRVALEEWLLVDPHRMMMTDVMGRVLEWMDRRVVF